jgi:hypothetical protein
MSSKDDAEISEHVESSSDGHAEKKPNSFESVNSFQIAG